MSDPVPILIVGAGPAGLVLGALLAERGVAFRIVEKGARAGASWAAMPKWLHLLSPWRSNYLLPRHKHRFPSLNYTSASDFATYLSEVSKDLPIDYGCCALALEGGEGDYTLLTSSGKLRASRIVVATGHYAHPVRPGFVDGASIPVVTLNELDRFEEGLAQKRVLVVGKRLSAGQIIERVVARGCEVDVAAQAEPKFFGSPAVTNLFLRRLEVFEAPKKWTKPKEPLHVGMPNAVKKLFQEGRVKLVPRVVSVEGRVVELEDGTRREYDALLLATGFRFGNAWLPVQDDLANLKDCFESPSRPGLFYLGADLQVDFTSRHLRGIRRDAVGLARLLERRIRNGRAAK